MMSVGDGRHRVYLEVLVGTDGRSALNGSPVGETWLSVVEPLVAKMLNVVVIEVAHTRSDFRTMNAAAKAQKLTSDFLVQLCICFLFEKAIPKVIAATNNFYVV